MKIQPTVVVSQFNFTIPPLDHRTLKEVAEAICDLENESILHPVNEFLWNVESVDILPNAEGEYKEIAFTISLGPATYYEEGDELPVIKLIERDWENVLADCMA